MPKTNPILIAVAVFVLILLFLTAVNITGIGTEPRLGGGVRCIAAAGFFCGSFIYSHTTGNVVFVFGQNTGETWTSWAIMYAPQGTPVGASLIAQNVTFIDQAGQLVSGQQTSITGGAGLTIINSSTGRTIGPVAVGTTTAGSIWVCYSTNQSTALDVSIAGKCKALGTNTIFYKQVATVTTRAT